MRHLRFTLPLLFALLALFGPALAAGVCIGMSKPHPPLRYEVTQPAHLPSPCEMQGGKRVAPIASPYRCPDRLELPRATSAQWALGLRDDLLLVGREPATDVPPPRFV